ncbi:hypothetical protein [Pseudomonas protegens]|uniref:hypothetical protein n=1 Tax=Pseudomonas protegens TaxID=380021 RepID=UPI00382F9C32
MASKCSLAGTLERFCPNQLPLEAAVMELTPPAEQQIALEMGWDVWGGYFARSVKTLAASNKAWLDWEARISARLLVTDQFHRERANRANASDIKA